MDISICVDGYTPCTLKLSSPEAPCPDKITGRFQFADIGIFGTSRAEFEIARTRIGFKGNKNPVLHSALGKAIPP